MTHTLRSIFCSCRALIVLLSFHGSVSAIAPEPLFPTFSITATPGSCNEIDLNFIPGDGARRLIVASPNVPVSQFPGDGISYMGGSIYGTGSHLGSNNYVVYVGTGTSTTISGLTGGTEYFFASFELNGSGFNTNYLTTGYPETSEIAPGFVVTLIASANSICDGASVTLEAHGGENYLWSPSTGLSSTTDSVVTATPPSGITYTVTASDANGCTDSKSTTINVSQYPNVTLNAFNPVCVNVNSFQLTGGSPVGGTYSGPGITNNIFDPAAAGTGTHQISYSYSNAAGCARTTTQNIDVLAAPSAAFATPAAVCEDVPAFLLTQGSPAGGNYFGTGVNSNQFNPVTAGAGQHLLGYSFINGQGCADTAYASIQVNALPSVNLAALNSVCENGITFPLTGGTPAGGNYSGVGVNTNQFAPALAGAGTFTITYTYTDSSGCTSSDTSSIVVFAEPIVNFATPSPVCQNTGPVLLSGGSPVGGFYTGQGVGGNVFYSGIAGVGPHTLTYTYTDTNNCSSTATAVITVNAAPTPHLGPDTTVCGDMAVTLTAGTGFSSYTWSTGSHAPSILIDTVGRGIGTFTFILTVTNSTNCLNRDTVNVTFDVCTQVNSISRAEYNIYPNPFSEHISISSDRLTDIFIYDSTGRLVEKHLNITGTIEAGSSLSPGLYIAQIGNKKIILIKE
jgi:hypothetical protein